MGLQGIIYFMDFPYYSSAIISAVVFAFKAMFVWAAAVCANEYNHRSEKSKWKKIANIVFVIAVIALIGALQLGSHVENEDMDPFTGGTVVQDYEPTTAQQIRTWLWIFTALIVPAGFGFIEKRRFNSKE